MYPLVETIKVMNGIPQNLIWHQKRYDHSFNSLFGLSPDLRLEDVIIIPEQFKSGKVKARFQYNQEGYKIEFRDYTAVPVKSLKVIEDDAIEYSLKYTDRRNIENLFLRKGESDDILIIKNGRITDTSIANIVLYNGEKWLTPDFPLLHGTARERLLSEGRIFSREIHIEDLKSYTHFRLINSMLEFDEQEMLQISSII